MTNNRALRVGASAGALATLGLTGLLALASQLTHVSFLPFNLADLAIRLTPGRIATFGIEALGRLAKMGVEAASIIGFILIGAALGAVFGWWAARNSARPTVVAGQQWSVLIMIGLLALQLSDPAAPSLDWLTTILLGVLSLGWGAAVGLIFGRLQPASLSPTADVTTVEEAGAADPGRRVFLQRSTAAAITLAIGGTAIAELLRQADENALAQAALPPAPRPPRPTPSFASFNIPAGVRPFTTPIDKLYTVASRTRDPVLDPATYRLAIDGAVGRPLSLSLADLQQRPRIDQLSTLECVSNEVGGGLIGNVNWNGTSLWALLEEARLEPGVQRLVFHAAESYVDSIPLDAAMLATTLVVYGADGRPLPRKHGFPVRIIVPSIYGMKNVKWLTRIEAVKTDFKGYWQERGWSNPAPVKTTAVTDTRSNLVNDRGIVPLGGIAFAGDRGISAVEVQIDGGDWKQATLADEASKVQWRLWRYDWPATPGKHRIAVRAVDGRGAPQSAEVTPPHPDGASGYHTIEVSV